MNTLEMALELVFTRKSILAASSAVWMWTGKLCHFGAMLGFCVTDQIGPALAGEFALLL